MPIIEAEMLSRSTGEGSALLGLDLALIVDIIFGKIDFKP